MSRHLRLPIVRHTWGSHDEAQWIAPKTFPQELLRHLQAEYPVLIRERPGRVEVGATMIFLDYHHGQDRFARSWVALAAVACQSALVASPANAAMVEAALKDASETSFDVLFELPESPVATSLGAGLSRFWLTGGVGAVVAVVVIVIAGLTFSWPPWSGSKDQVAAVGSKKVLASLYARVINNYNEYVEKKIDN